MKRLTPIEFIEKSILIHSDTYNYDKTKYEKATEKIIITCVRHGDFSQLPHTHLSGSGCPLCRGNVKKSNLMFIKESNLIHKNTYTYEKTDYINNKFKVIITCIKHGDFKQSPSSHLKGHGCKQCANEQTSEKLSLNSRLEFVNKVRLIHNDFYLYDKVVYLSSKEMVLITCKEHGDFPQTPSNHLSGQGCPTCANNQKFTREIFINKANIVHDGFYNYDKLVYENIDKKVIITCKEHGDFLQSPYNHLKKFGCKKCSGKEKKTTPIFIDQANKKHLYFYDYDKVVYLSSKDKVLITCKIHGDFPQTPSNHLRGHGCPKCNKRKRKFNSEFIEQASLVHNNKYSYPDINYIKAKTEVTIKCEVHGNFKQLPFNHLSGSGCPKCKMSKGEINIINSLEKLNIKFETQYKFDDCRFRYRLPFDFAVFINGNIGLIEFHGEQHYKAIPFFNKNNKFEELKIRDEVKLNYAITKNIKLLIIPFNQIDNIDELIGKFINENFQQQ